MRIVSGTHRGRKIIAPNDLPVRPTTDLAKESLFNILNNYYDFDDLTVLDLFAGIGSISFEFSSRGAMSVTSVEKEFKCVKFLNKTIEDMKFENIQVVKADAFKFLSFPHPAYDVIFADPPFDMEGFEQLPGLVFTNNLLKSYGRLIIEHPRNIDFSQSENYLETRNYGKVHFSFFGTQDI
ncbi:MAG: 16S rRNA (guanine(966)-N(2))-methyltransferase RsmD [Bacteroidales bacterium]|nr:16S rRNA (guanine(966)-N(2))-methyltransferase RsmD [Bacteroidales bacterium]